LAKVVARRRNARYLDKAIFWFRKAADHDEIAFSQNLAAQALSRLEKSRASKQEGDQTTRPLPTEVTGDKGRPYLIAEIAILLAMSAPNMKRSPA
jgi:hypothetical protein